MGVAVPVHITKRCKSLLFPQVCFIVHKLFSPPPSALSLTHIMVLILILGMTNVSPCVKDMGSLDQPWITLMT
jgi:hypothetical protein